MKCKYRFAVDGKLRPSVNVPVPSRGWLFEIETSEGLATYFTVTVPLNNREYWPKILQDPAPGIKAQFEVKTPDLPFIQRELRALQGVLSLFGLRSIDLENPEIEWLPESEEEKEDLHLFSHKRSSEPIPDNTIQPLSFDLLARAIIASDALTDVETPLNFFRRGMIDVYDRNYIEAIYDFYFILETMFGEGKHKKAAVLRAFRNSDQLRSCVQQAIDDPGLMIGSDQHIQEVFQKTYGSMDVEQVLEKVVELRGYLHHHTQKRRKTWHPDDQHRFECDALFLQTITYNVAFAIAEPYLWDEKVIRAYEELANTT